ncbi:MAG: hypothetical protein JNL51_12675 [Chitinophagaceae bacterium]|nr:hypothetical protein [Chitinophagaceae bacterium]
MIPDSIKRLAYPFRSNALVGDNDPEVLTKILKLKDELKAMQTALIEVPLVEAGDLPGELE